MKLFLTIFRKVSNHATKAMIPDQKWFFSLTQGVVSEIFKFIFKKKKKKKNPYFSFQKNLTGLTSHNLL